MQSPTELRQTITATIIEALESGNLPPWRRPWCDDQAGFGLATSLSTGQSYKGINQIILQVAASKNSWPSRWFGTFNQIRSAGGCVRQGEKATKVILWKPIERKRSNQDGEKVDDSFLVMREFCVFNAEQTTGLDQYRVGFAQRQLNSDERYEHADAVIDSIGADIRYGGNQAFYNTTNDFIQLPYRHQFETPESFYETAFHEHAHFSEHPTRLNWNRAEEGYAMGELIAEMSGCMMIGELRLPMTTNLQMHCSYLKTWLDGMGRDPRFIFRAASQASKVVDFLMSFSRTTSETTEIAEEPVLV